MRDAKIKKFYKEINRLLHLKESTPVEDEKLSDIEGRFYDSLRSYSISSFIKVGLLTCMKMKEFGPRWRGASLEPSAPPPPLDPPILSVLFVETNNFPPVKSYLLFPVLKSGNITHALCDVYNHDANRKRITVTSLWKEYLDVDYQDITMVLQLTVDRINLLSVHASHWIGPMSVTIYIKRKHLLDLGSILSTMDPVLQRNNIDLHIVLKEGVGTKI